MDGVTLGLLPPLGGSLANLKEIGQHHRLLQQYFRVYARSFSRTLYFSYAQETLEQYTNDPELLSQVRVVPGSPNRSYTFRMPFFWRNEIGQCDVLRVFQVTGVIPAMFAKVRWKIPFAVTYGYQYARVSRIEGFYWRAAMLYLLEQIGLRTADAVIVTTPALSQYVSRRAKTGRVCLIPNSVDTEQFLPADHLPGTRTLIFVGRLEPQKNLVMLLEAVAQISPSPKLVIVGDGSQRELLSSEAERLGVDLELKGVLGNDAVPGILQRADAFVLPSLIEGHPKALLEAMSCGLPCVGLDVPGTRDVIAHERTGLLCGPTSQSLTEALQRILDERDLAYRLGRSARAWIEANLSADALMEREVSLLSQLAGARLL